MRRNVLHLSLICGVSLGLAVFSGCDRRTPDERLTTAVQFYQQGDAASAEMEALKVVEKASDEPVGAQASLLLAQIYTQQNRLEEAEIQLQSALNQLSQLDPMGKDALRMYLGTLTAQRKFDEALETAERFQQEYAEDPGTSLSLRVVKADIQTVAGETTAARQQLQTIIDETTGPAELALYRDLYLKTFQRDQNTTAAIEYLQGELDQATERQQRISLITGLAQITAANDDYRRSRGYLGQLTGLIMEDIRQEPTVIGRASRALQLGQIYLSADNLPGADRVFEALYDLNLEQSDAVEAVVSSYFETQMRLGETSAAMTLLQENSEKFPDGPFASVLQRMESVIAEGRLQELAPADTSTLVMQYREDQELLWPPDLPEVLAVPDGQVPGQPVEPEPEAQETEAEPQPESVDGQTTGTAAVDQTTTGSEPVLDNSASEVTEPEDAATPAEEGGTENAPAPAPVEDAE